MDSTSSSNATRQHAPEPDGALRGAFRDGRPEAVCELANRFFDDVVRFCTAMTGSEEDGLDAVQETFLRVFEMHRRYDAARPFRPWLFGIARNCSAEVRRKGAIRAARVVDLDAADGALESVESPEASPLELLLREELARDALELLAQLDEPQRAVVLLRLTEDLSFREVGEALQKPAPTVATTYYRAIAELKRRAARHPAWRERLEDCHGD